jgi:hypothetical protein
MFIIHHNGTSTFKEAVKALVAVIGFIQSLDDLLGTDPAALFRDGTGSVKL